MLTILLNLINPHRLENFKISNKCGNPAVLLHNKIAKSTTYANKFANQCTLKLVSPRLTAIQTYNKGQKIYIMPDQC